MATREEEGDGINFIKRYPRAIAAGEGKARQQQFCLFQEVINAVFIREML